MFISTSEKNIINDRLQELEKKVTKLINLIAPEENEPRKKGNRQWSEKTKAEASARMKKYWADKKTKKETS